MRRFVETADAVGATTKKLEKVRLLSEFFQSLDTTDAALAARFFSACAFAGYDERTLGIGGANLSRVIAEAAGKGGESLGAAYRKHGDLGDMAAELLRVKNRQGDLPLSEVAKLFEELAAARVQATKAELLAKAERVKTAVVMGRLGCDRASAEAELERCGGRLSRIIGPPSTALP